MGELMSTLRSWWRRDSLVGFLRGNQTRKGITFEMKIKKISNFFKVEKIAKKEKTNKQKKPQWAT